MSLTPAQLAAINAAVAAALAGLEQAEGGQPAAQPTTPPTGRRPDGRRRPKPTTPAKGTPAADLAANIGTPQPEDDADDADRDERAPVDAPTEPVLLDDLDYMDCTFRTVKVKDEKTGKVEVKKQYLKRATRQFLRQRLQSAIGAKGLTVNIPFKLEWCKKTGTPRFVATPIVAFADPSGEYSVQTEGNQSFYLAISQFNRHQ